MGDNYTKGMVDGIKLWGETCGRQGSCDKCPIGIIRGTGVTCQDFARQFPQKMLSLLSEIHDGEISYYQEFCMRFPESNMTVKQLADCVCRRTAFEGYVECEGGDCVSCWKETYIGDVTPEAGGEEGADGVAWAGDNEEGGI